MRAFVRSSSLSVTMLPPLPSLPGVSVVVPARNAATSLPVAVRSALAQDYDGPLEVVIAVGPSQDDTERVAADWATLHPSVRTVANPEGTTPTGLNRAITAAHGTVIVRLDAHSELGPAHVRRAVELLRKTGAANVGGPQLPRAADGFGAGVAAAMRSRVGSGGARYRTGGASGPVDTVYLGAFHRAALEAVDGYDERYIRNQDYELNYRLRRAGYTVWFDPELAVRYAPRRSPVTLWRQYFSYGAWKRQMLMANPRSVRVRQLAAPTLVLALAVSGLMARSRRTACLLPIGYVSGTGLAALQAARGMRDTPATWLALVIMHVGWGLGFLIGRTNPERP